MTERRPERQASGPARSSQRPSASSRSADRSGGRSAASATPKREEPAGREATRKRSRILGGLVLALAGLLLVLDPGRPAVEHQIPSDDAPHPVRGNELVVDLVDHASAEEAAELGASLGLTLRFNSAHSQKRMLMIAEVPPSRRSELLIALRASPLVEYAEPNWMHELLGTAPNDPRYSEQWHLHKIGVEDAWKHTKGDGAVVAVLDSGVASADTSQGIQIQDLTGSRFLTGYDFVDDDDIAQELGGHGSHVAGTIAQSTDNGVLGAGVAPEATILPVRVITPLGGDSADIVEGVRFAVDEGADVINMSLGGGPYSKMFDDAIAEATAAGVTVICAAGNTGQEGVNYPARYDDAIAVSAVDPDLALAPYSTWGAELDIAAPGGDLRRPGGGVYQNTFVKGQDVWAGFQGTSMAAPHVAGAAALLYALGVDDPVQVRSLLLDNAMPKAPAERYGRGVLDAAAAVEEASLVARAQRGRLSLLALAGCVLLAMGSSQKGKRRKNRSLVQSSLALGVGLVLPDLVVLAVGYGSALNLAGHSVLLPFVLLSRRGWRKPALKLLRLATLGLVLHLGLDLLSGDSPFDVVQGWRASFWLVVNIGLGVALLHVSRPVPKQIKRSAPAPRAALDPQPA